MKDDTTVFPDDRIVLLDGRELECIPKAGATSCIDNDMALDTTGQFFSVGTRRKVSGKDKTEDPAMIQFLKNAFLFYSNADRILSDSKMFLAPVPVQSGLAYTGTSGFRCPTLGVYVEWWKNCVIDLTKDSDGKEALTYHVAGSPLSGSNKCSCVHPDGSTCTIVHNPFLPVWRSFIEINSRYDEAKSRYEAYSLEEVAQLLRNTVNNPDS